MAGSLIRRDAVYTMAEVKSLLSLPDNCLPREIKLGRLRVSRRAGRYLFLGAWLLEWIEAGEVQRSRGDSPQARAA